MILCKTLGERTGLKVSEFALGTGMFGQTLSNFPAWRFATTANTADLSG